MCVSDCVSNYVSVCVWGEGAESGGQIQLKSSCRLGTLENRDLKSIKGEVMYSIGKMYNMSDEVGKMTLAL